jgi:hypothetical protein
MFEESERPLLGFNESIMPVMVWIRIQRIQIRNTASQTETGNKRKEA